MFNYFRGWISKLLIFKKNEKGSFTIEASLVFPLIFLITLGLLLVSIVIYEQVYFYYIATQAVERSAYTWDNSNKNPYTGAFHLGEYDGLYWRLTDDNILDLFIEDSDSNSKRVVLGEAKYEDLTEKKLNNVAVEIPSGINGELIYTNNLVERRVTAKLQSKFKLPSSIKLLLGSDVINVTASATVTDPVEFIRTVNLVTDNADKLTNGDKSKAKNVLDKQKENDK